MVPHTSTTPSATVTFSVASGAHDSFSSVSSSLLRIARSSRGAGGAWRAVTDSARSRSARLHTPITRSCWTTGTRLIRCFSISSTMAESDASASTDTTSVVITSDTFRPCAWVKSSACRPGETSSLSHQERWRPVPSSERRSRSPSVTTPARWPAASTTSTPEMWCSSISVTASPIGVSGVTESTRRVITSAAFMVPDPLFSGPDRGSVIPDACRSVDPGASADGRRSVARRQDTPRQRRRDHSRRTTGTSAGSGISPPPAGPSRPGSARS